MQSPAEQISPPLRFLLEAVAAQLGKRPSPPVPAGLDTGGIAELVRYHKLQLAMNAPLGLPEAQEREVSDARKTASAHVMVHVQELAAVTRSFAAAGIPMLVLKGLPLSVQLYGTPLGRQCGDIDLLVRPRDMARSLKLLAASGYGVDDGGTEHHANAVLRKGWRCRTYARPYSSELGREEAK